MTRPDPRAERPQAPEGYGYSTDPEGMLTWDRVSEALASAGVYWVSSVRPDGSPHTHSIWGGFVANRLYFEGGDTTRWARNLAVDPRVGFGVEAGGLHINGRGMAAQATAGEDFEALRSAYGDKYDYRPEHDQFWRVEPFVIVALDMSSLESFAQTPTRFVFPSEETP